MINQNILKTIGNTPLIKLNNFNLLGDIFVKNEAINPGGSVKDRAALSMITSALESGELNLDSHVIEATSGNTGVGLALVCAVLNIKLTVCMPDSMSAERIKAIKAYGANIILTPGNDGMLGAVNQSKILLQQANTWTSNQFANPNNIKAHYKTTGPEIWQQTAGKITHFVAGVGTGGTIMGVGKFLKEQNPQIKIIAVEPSKSPVLSRGEKSANSHNIQGIGANFVPANINFDLIDQIIKVTDEDASTTARILATKEGIKSGFSTGANVYASLSLASQNNSNFIVTIVCDTGDRYYSTNLYS